MELVPIKSPQIMLNYRRESTPPKWTKTPKRNLSFTILLLFLGRAGCFLKMFLRLIKVFPCEFEFGEWLINSCRSKLIWAAVCSSAWCFVWRQSGTVVSPIWQCNHLFLESRLLNAYLYSKYVSFVDEAEDNAYQCRLNSGWFNKNSVDVQSIWLWTRVQ